MAYGAILGQGGSSNSVILNGNNLETISGEDINGKVILSVMNPAVENQNVRNIYAGTADLTAGQSALSTGTIYLVYE